MSDYFPTFTPPSSHSSSSSQPASDPAPRHRGGQPGNTNALKHGFYARQLNSEDLSGLTDTPLSALVEDITVLRVNIRRLMDASLAANTLSERLETTRVLCLAYSSLTRLIRTHHLLTGGKNPIMDEWQNAISQAFEVVIHENQEKGRKEKEAAEARLRENSSFSPYAPHS